ncbi:hypothetical protein KEM56_007247 [Ascosphaera pollenicola]|nr:hypothetical protein KEM56_007247 [Ascosphaera pollenicola]
MKLVQRQLDRLAQPHIIGVIAYILCVAAEFLAGLAALVNAVLTPTNAIKVLPVIISATLGLTLPSLALLVAYLYPYHTERPDAFHPDSVVTFQCSYKLTADDQSGTRLKNLASDYNDLQKKCIVVRVSLIATVVFHCLQVVVLLSPLRLLFVNPGSTRNPRSLTATPRNRAEQIELVPLPNNDDAPGIPAGATVQRDVRSSEEETRLGSSDEWEQILPRPSLARQRDLRQSFDISESPMLPQFQQDEEQRRSRSTALSSLPTRPNPAAVRAISRRGRTRRLTPTVEEGQEEDIATARPQEEFSPLDNNHFGQPH